ncbi:MAG: hypothetical protein HYY37_05885 [Candidatus Aenigmarchaeota archaeon]|nr:hypothetical protein [Candidatus Aenigmarchaeota archaeon]
MSKTTVTVRDVDEEIFRKFRALSVEEKAKLGDALSVAMKHWLEYAENKNGRPDPKNLLKIKGIVTTRKKVKWSEEIDGFLYGLKK